MLDSVLIACYSILGIVFLALTFVGINKIYIKCCGCKGRQDSSTTPVELTQVAPISNSPPQVLPSSSVKQMTPQHNFSPTSPTKQSLPDAPKILDAKISKKPANFLELLDQLEDTTQFESDDKKTKKKTGLLSISPSSEIEASSSDETASQTYIGKIPDESLDPGPINLNLIEKKHNKFT